VFQVRWRRPALIVLGLLLTAAAVGVGVRVLGPGGAGGAHGPRTRLGNDLAKAADIALDAGGAGRQQGVLECVGSEHLYRVVAPTAGVMTVEIASDSGSAAAVLLHAYDADRVPLTTSGTMARLRVTAGGVYYLKASSSLAPPAGQASTGAYVIEVKTVQVQADDHGSDFASARELTLEPGSAATVAGRLEAERDVDFFHLQAPRSGKLRLELGLPAPANLDAGVYIYDAARLPAAVAGQGGQVLELLLTSGAQLYIKVAPASVAGTGQLRTGSYTLRLTQTADASPQAKLGGAREVTLALSGPTSASGSIVDPARGDSMWFRAPRHGLAVIEVKPDSASELAAGVAALDKNHVPLAAGNRPLAEFAVIAGETYHVKVSPRRSARPGSTATGAYVLTVNFDDLDDDDYGNEIDQAHSVALDVKGTAAVTGKIEVPGDEDCFQIEANQDGFLTITNDTSVTVLNARLSIRSGSDWTMINKVPVARGQTCYFKVAGWPAVDSSQRATGKYRFAVQITPLAADAPVKAIDVTLLAVGRALRAGNLPQPDAAHEYRLKAPLTGGLKVTLQPSAKSKFRGRLAIFDDLKKLLGEAGADATQVLQVSVERGRSYVVKVRAQPDLSAVERLDSYSIEFRAQP
jgi:hypothetical protein